MTPWLSLAALADFNPFIAAATMFDVESPVYVVEESKRLLVHRSNPLEKGEKDNEDGGRGEAGCGSVGGVGGARGEEEMGM